MLFYICTAPVYGLISTSFSFKWCTVIGGILAGLGMVASAFPGSVEMLFLTYGVILGMLYSYGFFML
jgi:hypothetical protein